MKVTSQGKELPLSEVAKLPVLEGDGEPAKEILDSIPDAPVCVKCKKLASEVSPDGFCNICQPPLPKVLEEPKPEPRPSLEVETEVNCNLKPRIMAHVGRMRAWDLRKLEAPAQASFRAAIDELSTAADKVEFELVKLKLAGFVAKTTPVTRIAAKLARGTQVDLREDQRATFSMVYTEEQLNSLSVVQATDSHVLLAAADGTNIGLVKIIHVEPKS
ncbi:MAG TPA: hypothetical protein VIV60_04440 [Polyangiaceae bacterium]